MMNTENMLRKTSQIRKFNMKAKKYGTTGGDF